MKKILLVWFFVIGVVSAQIFVEPMLPRRASSSTVFFDTTSYVGDGVDNRAINLGGQWDWVMIKAYGSSAAYVPVMRTSSMTGDSTKRMGTSATTYFVNGIQELNATGMVVGTDTTVNGVSVRYIVQMLKVKPGVISVGHYTGNNTDNRWLVDVFGISAPSVLMIWTNSASNVRLKTRSMQDSSVNTWDFGTDNGSVNQIQAIGTVGDSVQLGNTAVVNGAGTTHEYLSIKYETGLIEGGVYSGDGTNGRQVTTGTFQPEMAWLIPATATAKSYKVSSYLPANTNFSFTGFTSTTGWGAFHSTGITVNNVSGVNQLGVTEYYVVFNKP